MPFFVCAPLIFFFFFFQTSTYVIKLLEHFLLFIWQPWYWPSLYILINFIGKFNHIPRPLIYEYLSIYLGLPFTVVVLNHNIWFIIFYRIILVWYGTTKANLVPLHCIATSYYFSFQTISSWIIKSKKQITRTRSITNMIRMEKLHIKDENYQHQK